MINNSSNNNLLIVDDEPSVINSIRRVLRKENYTVYSADSGESGLEVLKKYDIGVILSDVMMPGMDGVAFLELSREYRPEAVRLLLTAHAKMENAIDAINRSKIFGYFTKPWSQEELKGGLAKAFEYYNLVIENKRLYELTQNQNGQLRNLNENLESLVRKRTIELETAVREGVFMLANAAEAKDDDTGEHVSRIRDLTFRLCVRLGFSTKRSEEIGFSSIMHDVGKIHIPDVILKKKGPLTAEEYEIIKTHTLVGEKILGNKPFYKTAREIARSHHEAWDGSGYPDGLMGKTIPVSARIVTVVDVFDALIHVRPYKPAWPVEHAVAEMKGMSGKAFDPEISKIFFEDI